jgi:hypothetical protein
MKWATRMICGYCSREMKYSNSNATCACGKELVRREGSGGSFWEGTHCTRLVHWDSHDHLQSVRWQGNQGSYSHESQGRQEVCWFGQDHFKQSHEVIHDVRIHPTSCTTGRQLFCSFHTKECQHRKQLRHCSMDKRHSIKHPSLEHPNQTMTLPSFILNEQVICCCTSCHRHPSSS